VAPSQLRTQETGHIKPLLPSVKAALRKNSPKPKRKRKIQEPPQGMKESHHLVEIDTSVVIELSCQLVTFYIARDPTDL